MFKPKKFPLIHETNPAAGDLKTWDLEHVWHPFTQMEDWERSEILFLEEGRGAKVRDSEGRWYIDGNASIWTNIHGHRNARLDAALHRQLEKIAHTSFLGFSNPVAARLCAELCALWPEGTLTRAFLSDDGSTAIEVALKMAVQAFQQTGFSEKRKFVAFRGAYHGDTMGASSLGGIPLFHERFAAWQFPVVHVGGFEELAGLDASELAGVVIEPLVQGANQMTLWPAGLLAQLREWCDETGVFLIADEVMTGFGRTGTLFACEREGVVPDFVALAKGLTGGYMPLAATLTSERVFQAFSGGKDRTLYYGHSYAGHQLACAVALENLAIFREERVLERLAAQIQRMEALLEQWLRPMEWVFAIRQCGFLAGIEVRQSNGEIFPAEVGMGAQVCLAARGFGLLTRPIRDTLVLMPPFCISDEELDAAVQALAAAIRERCGAVPL
ncbi:MAG: adenosylmethionine--8-amino-7-oxononanoate transaminase [Verrucomicrobiota bacterium]